MAVGIKQCQIYIITSLPTVQMPGLCNNRIEKKKKTFLISEMQLKNKSGTLMKLGEKMSKIVIYCYQGYGFEYTGIEFWGSIWPYPWSSNLVLIVLF